MNLKNRLQRLFDRMPQPETDQSPIILIEGENPPAGDRLIIRVQNEEQRANLLNLRELGK